MSTHPAPDPALRERLERAADGLVYTSESDRPFTFAFFPGAAETVRTPADLAAHLGLPPDTPAGSRTLDDFFARHAETSDPWDAGAQAIRPRYEALRELLRRELADVRVYRLGRVEVRCFVVGDDGRGNLAGLETVAIET